MLAERGFGVLALEPSASMASVARRHCAGFPLVEVALTDFENWADKSGFQSWCRRRPGTGSCPSCATAWRPGR